MLYFLSSGIFAVFLSSPATSALISPELGTIQIAQLQRESQQGHSQSPLLVPEPLPPTLPRSRSPLPSPENPAYGPLTNLDPDVEQPSPPSSVPAEPKVPSTPMPQPAEPGLPPPPMPQPAEPRVQPPLSEGPESEPSLPTPTPQEPPAPGHEPTSLQH